MKFESQHEWTPPQIFFCGHRVLQLFCQNVEWAYDIKWVKTAGTEILLISETWSKINRGSHRRSSIKTGVLNNFLPFTGKYMCQSLIFIKVAVLTLWHRGFPVNFLKFLRYISPKTPLEHCFSFKTVDGFIFFLLYIAAFHTRETGN